MNLSLQKILSSVNNCCIFTLNYTLKEPRMNHYNRLNELLIEYTILSQSKSVPNFEKTEYTDLIDYCITSQNFDWGLKAVDSAIQLFSSSIEFIVKKIKILLLLNQPEQALDLLDSIDHLPRLTYEAQILKAKALKATGNDKAALKIIDGLDNTAKNDFDVYQLKADLLENLGQFEHLYHMTKNQIFAAPKDQIDALLEKFSFFTEITSNYSDAINIYKEVIDLHPFSSTAWQNLGLTYGFLDNCKEAVDAFEYCIAINPKNRAAYFGCAECLEKTERYDLALNYYNEYLDTTQLKNPDAIVRLANCFYHMDDIDSAKHWLLEAININPELPEAFAILGLIYETSAPDKAISYYEEAMDIDPFNEDYIIDLAELHYSLQNMQTAKQLFQQAIDTAPDVIETWIPYIRFLINTDQHQLLLENLEEVSSYFNEDKVIFLKIAVLFALEKRKEAIYWLAEALATYDESPELLFRISSNLSFDQDVIATIKKYRD